MLFRNVNVRYRVTSFDLGHHYENRGYYFTEVNPVNNTAAVRHVRINNSLNDAMIDHFNSIQRGYFHTYLPNVINPNSHGRGIRSPLDQFALLDYVTIDIALLAKTHLSYTNIGLYLTISGFLSIALNFLATNYNKITGNYWSISQESTGATIQSIVVNQINDKKGQNYYPFIYCLFIFILVSNLIGMVPYNLASTSHFILTFFISFTVVLGSTFLGFMLHELGFFSLFVPAGCPLGLLPLLVLIEFISYLARNVSLGLRLAANILSGHMLLNILSEFTYNIMDTNIFYFFLGLIPVIFIIAFSGLELGIAFIQAQVFVVLSCSYLSDALLLH